MLGLSVWKLVVHFAWGRMLVMEEAEMEAQQRYVLSHSQADGFYGW